jgi:type IX secretion system PorP/SprF family membrane protein
MRGFAIIIFSFLMEIIVAQPLARYNLYPHNPNFSNPAATGLTNCTEFNATDMHQWVGIKDAPTLQSLNIQKGKHISKSKKHGLGVNVVRDINGLSKSLGGELIYSFHVLVGKNRTSWLSLGLSGNVEQRSLDESGFSPIYDPLVTGSLNQEIVYNASSGFYLYNEKYFAGLAIYNLLPINNSLGMGYGGERCFMSVQGGYVFDSRRLPVKIQTSFQGSRGNDIMQIDFINKLFFQNNIWTGLTLRKYLGNFETVGQNALVFIGYLRNSWSFSYNYNIDINGTQFHHYGIHQLSISYKICPGKYDCPTYK